VLQSAALQLQCFLLNESGSALLRLYALHPTLEHRKGQLWLRNAIAATKGRVGDKIAFRSIESNELRGE
jgi:hypothetical protein